MSAPAAVLEVEGLRVEYPTPRGVLAAVDDIDFTVRRGEILGLIGESGSGKTTTAMAVLRLIQPPGTVGGSATLDGDTDLLSLGDKALRQLRWRSMALIPQGALNALNPLLRIGDQLSDVILTHEGRAAKKGLAERLDALYATVGLPRRVGRLYPHELSGGMRQRVCIAMAIALDPPLVIADEPTSALDVIVQRVVAQTLLDVKRRLGTSFILIGHDIGLMAQLADRVAVMYRGKIVEIGSTDELFASPRHPYTRMLMDAVPAIGHRAEVRVVDGLAPDPFDQTPGCVFQRRCPYVFEPCRVAHPPLEQVSPDHRKACYLPADALLGEEVSA